MKSTSLKARFSPVLATLILTLAIGVWAEPTRSIRVEAYPPETTIRFFTPTSPPEGDLVPNNQEFLLGGQFLSLKARFSAPGFEERTEEVVLTDLSSTKPNYWVHQTRLIPATPVTILRTQWDLNPWPLYGAALGGILFGGGLLYGSNRRRQSERKRHQEALAAAAALAQAPEPNQEQFPADLTGRDIDSYQVVKRIGSGAFSVVYQAKHKDWGDLVALKLLNLGDTDSDSTARFRREIAIGRELEHPNVVRMHAFGSVHKFPYIVSEYIPGETLEEVLQRGKLDPRKAVEFTEQLVSGVAYAHAKGVAHRDLKPANIFISETGRLKILDFGMAKFLNSEQKLTKTGQALGTPLYMSPEQIRTKFGPASDYYAIGVILFEMLTGRTPFTGDNALEVLSAHAFKAPPRADHVDPQVPKELADIVESLLIKDMAERLSDPERILQALQDYVGAHKP